MYTYRVDIERNVFDAGHFIVVRLYHGQEYVDGRVFDGTFLQALAERRAERHVRKLERLYGATRID